MHERRRSAQGVAIGWTTSRTSPSFFSVVSSFRNAFGHFPSKLDSFQRRFVPWLDSRWVWGCVGFGDKANGFHWPLMTSPLDRSQWGPFERLVAETRNPLATQQQNNNGSTKRRGVPSARRSLAENDVTVGNGANEHLRTVRDAKNTWKKQQNNMKTCKRIDCWPHHFVTSVPPRLSRRWACKMHRWCH